MRAFGLATRILAVLASTACVFGACSSTGFKPEIVAGAWECSADQVTAIRVSKRCAEREFDVNGDSGNGLGRLLRAAVSDPEPRSPTGESSTSVRGGHLGVWDTETCHAVYDVRGCGWHQAALCTEDGRCWLASERRSFPPTDADCRVLPRCHSYGECGLRESESPSDYSDYFDVKCVAASATDCAASTEACAIMGRCGLNEGRCEATSDGDCAASSWCKNLGRCTAEGGGCVADTESDCRGSVECATRGRCYPRDGICVSDAPPTRP